MLLFTGRKNGILKNTFSKYSKVLTGVPSLASLIDDDNADIPPLRRNEFIVAIQRP